MCGRLYSLFLNTREKAREDPVTSNLYSIYGERTHRFQIEELELSGAISRPIRNLQGSPGGAVSYLVARYPIRNYSQITPITQILNHYR